MCEVYEVFSSDWRHTHRFDDEALIELFNHESYGTPIELLNGYALGKKWLNVTLAMWLEDIRAGNLFKYELYSDPKLPHWWLDSVLQNVRQGPVVIR